MDHDGVSEVLTIGAYGHSKDSFVGSLLAHDVDLLVDVRQRRGVRGAKYSFVNAVALRSLLKGAGIGYLHLKEMAPTTAIRASQWQADSQARTTKGDRQVLSDRFIFSYQEGILQHLNIEEVVRRLSGYSRVCFFCVEGSPEACHRSLAASWLAEGLGIDVKDICC